MNRYQSAEYERCRNGCCTNTAAVNDPCPQCDTCAEAAAATEVAIGCGCGCGNGQNAAANNGNGCGCCDTAASVQDLDGAACVCAVIEKINELLAVLRAAGIIGNCN